MVDLILAGGDAEVLRRLTAASGRSVEAELINLIRHSRPPAPTKNGSATFTVTCFGCGLPFESTRRPLPNRRNWCQDCKDKGEPAAQRARDHRAKKHEGEAP